MAEYSSAVLSCPGRVTATHNFAQYALLQAAVHIISQREERFLKRFLKSEFLLSYFFVRGMKKSPEMKNWLTVQIDSDLADRRLR